MWGCAPFGELRNVLFLSDRGSRSYIKFSGQRIPATHTSVEAERTWTFGANSIVLTADGIAAYHERGTIKARFKCRLMEG